MAKSKRWQPWENDENAKLAREVAAGRMSVNEAAGRFAKIVGGTAQERKINIRAALNARRGAAGKYPRYSRDLRRAVLKYR